jgi:two-component sensor histidine kinase
MAVVDTLRVKTPETFNASHPISDPRAELMALRTIGRALNSAWDLETTLQLISRTTADVMRMDSCSIYLFDPTGQMLILKASTGLSHDAVGQAQLKLGEGITGHAAQIGQPVAARDAAHDPHFKYLPETQEQVFKSLLAVPLVSQGKTIGAMNVQTKKYHRFTQPEIELLSLVGDLAAGALERANLHDHLQRQVQELSTLAQVSQTVTKPLYLDEMLAVVVQMAAQIMRARACALLLFDKDREALVLRASHGLSVGHRRNFDSPLLVQHSLTGQVVMRGEPVAVRDIRDDPLYQNRELAKQEGLIAFLSVPLRVGEKIIGAFSCYMDTTHEFNANEIELFSTLANQTALAIENAHLAMNAMVVREMHHRIKNNLQMVAMLLRLQLRGSPEISARDVLHQTVNRIMSIAAVHEALSQEGFSLIDVKSLIGQAAHMATQNMLRPGQDIRVTVSGDELKLSSQPATTLAVVANELIQNALEHGFGDNACGVVQVVLQVTEQELRLQVMDDGVGLPANFQPQSSLGLQIVETLITEDLRGQFVLKQNERQRGTTALLIIPKDLLFMESDNNAGAIS